jgi:hypothetical protein
VIDYVSLAGATLAGTGEAKVAGRLGQSCGELRSRSAIATRARQWELSLHWTRALKVRANPHESVTCVREDLITELPGGDLAECEGAGEDSGDSVTMTHSLHREAQRLSGERSVGVGNEM